MPLKLVRLELARTPEYPEGSRKHGCEFIAPLAEDGHIDRPFKAIWIHDPPALRRDQP